MDLNLKGKVAIVTGAGGGGIGTSVSYELASEGAIVVANDIDRPWADRVAKQLNSQGSKAIATYADVTSFNECQAMVSKALAEFSRVDILVTIPAYMGYGSFAHTSMDDHHRVVDVTFWGTLNAIKAVLKPMLAQRSGSIVCMGSDSARMAPPGESMYAASKAAIMTFATCLAKEVGSSGVRINVVNAALVSTPGQEGMAGGFAHNYPLGRFPEPKEVAEAIAFLASDRAAMITGQSLSVNSGRL
ncbi:MAG: SDR family oxidoreductase [Dehalococcoidia bacterium]|nr:SDR family oxidoreductase [Dehalococcoidia bacterium]